MFGPDLEKAFIACAVVFGFLFTGVVVGLWHLGAWLFAHLHWV